MKKTKNIDELFEITRELATIVIELGTEKPKILGDSLISQALSNYFLRNQINQLEQRLAENNLPIETAEDTINDTGKVFCEVTSQVLSVIEEVKSMDDSIH